MKTEELLNKLAEMQNKMSTADEALSNVDDPSRTFYPEELEDRTDDFFSIGRTLIDVKGTLMGLTLQFDELARKIEDTEELFDSIVDEIDTSRVFAKEVVAAAERDYDCLTDARDKLADAGVILQGLIEAFTPKEGDTMLKEHTERHIVSLTTIHQKLGELLELIAKE